MKASATLVHDPSSEEGLEPEFNYPTSDGLALLGTSRHEDAVHLARATLHRHFRGRSDLFIASLMSLYYVPRSPRRCLIPDLFVAFGVGGHARRVYKVWEEGGVVPQFVLEVASRSTVDRDCKFKRREYERIGVSEYWQLDQTKRLLTAPLVGHRLRRGRYERLRACGRWQGAAEFMSEKLGLLLRSKWHHGGLTVAFRIPETGREILAGEDVDRALREKDRALREKDRALRDSQRALRAATNRAEVAERRIVELTRALDALNPSEQDD